jgi:peroxiredoxin
LEDNSGGVFDYFGIIDSRYADSKREGIPYASTYVINKDRKVTYAYIAFDYKERPSNKIIMNEIINALNE